MPEQRPKVQAFGEPLFQVSKLSRNEASMISMPPIISAAAGIVSRMTTRGSNAPKPASRHCQNAAALHRDRKSTRLNSSHTVISYAVFCLKKKKADNGLGAMNEVLLKR